MKAGCKGVYIGYFKQGACLRTTMEEMKGLDIENLATSQFDSSLHVISKTQDAKNPPEEIEKIKACFKEVVPWSKKIKQRLKRRFEIVGLPLHI